MAYCTASDVQSEFKKLTVGASTPVTSTEITEFIVQADALINARLANRWITPITGTESLSIIKMISILLVKERIEKILSVKTGKPEGSQEQDEPAQDTGLGMLNQIMDGKLLLTDATLANSKDGVSSYNVDNDIEATFDSTGDLW